jgi:hypothetical protein
MTIIPQQYFGAGDAIFIQSLLRQIAQPGDRILYPILQQFVEGFNRAYTDVMFVDHHLIKVNYESKVELNVNGCRILPIRYADQILGVPYHHCMRAKYDLFGLDFNTWRDVRPKADHDKQRELYWRMVKEVDGTDYNLISPYYGSGSQFKADIAPNNGLPNIHMTSLQGYSLFDWQMLIENATTIHAVSSSIVYLLELLDLRAIEAHLYGRHHEPKTWLKNIDYLLTKQYEIH